MHYAHLSREERYLIKHFQKKQYNVSKIAKELNRVPSTISRELKRNTGLKGYRFKQAHELSESRKKMAKKATKLTGEVIQKIEKGLNDDWSPEQIVGRLKKENIVNIHHETVYRYILKDKKNGGNLYTLLRHQNKTYRKRYGSEHSRSGISNRVDIDERPKEANNRDRFGDWEADTIIGNMHKGAIATLDERTTKLRMAFPVGRKLAINVTHGILNLLGSLKDHVLSITFDNGKEFANHEEIAKKLECNTYFAKPYHSWERGQNENANGLLRQYFPKKMELLDVSVKSVIDAVDKLNNRPKKCLGYKTPYEAFEEKTGITREQLTNLCCT